MKRTLNEVKSGFTLIELLVVVLIIGILSAIALPMYRKAVESSRVTDALNTMQAVAKSEHGWYLTNNSYTKDFANLDIDLIDENGNKAEGISYDTVNYTFTLQDNSIKAERNNDEYTLYKSYEDGNIYCLPANHYICEQYFGVDKNVCNNKLSGFWSNLKNNCYGSDQERCADNGEYGATWQTSNGGYCGFVSRNGVRVEEFQECSRSHCSYSTYTGEGAKCMPSGSGGCSYSEYHQGAECHGHCLNSTFTTGGICYASGGTTCSSGYFTSNSKCIENVSWPGCSSSTFEDGAECIGNKSGNGGCRLNTYKAGGKCIAYGSGSCSTDHLGGIHPEYFEPGSFCIGEGANACRNMKNFKATCVANAPGACSGNTYTGDGCCKGDYCPTNDQNVVICND